MFTGVSPRTAAISIGGFVGICVIFPSDHPFMGHLTIYTLFFIMFLALTKHATEGFHLSTRLLRRTGGMSLYSSTAPIASNCCGGQTSPMSSSCSCDCSCGKENCSCCRINKTINLSDPKVATSLTLQPGGKFAACRCWKSSKFPACDGSHNAHNKATGDNVGPLIITVANA